MDGIIAKNSQNGMGVFASKPFARGEFILSAKGRILDDADFEDGSYEDCHCLQIGEHTYIGASGEIDDFVNHSCDPNAGYKITGEQADLVAIRDIQAGEEITFDYSTSMHNDANELDCACGAPHCRGRIRDFQYLPTELKARYVSLGIVPEFIVNMK